MNSKIIFRNTMYLVVCNNKMFTCTVKREKCPIFWTIKDSPWSKAVHQQGEELPFRTTSVHCIFCSPLIISEFNQNFMWWVIRWSLKASERSIPYICPVDVEPAVWCIGKLGGHVFSTQAQTLWTVREYQCTWFPIMEPKITLRY